MVRIWPVVIWSRAAKSLLVHISLVAWSQFMVAAVSAEVSPEEGGALTAGEPPPPHPVTVRPVKTRPIAARALVSGRDRSAHGIRLDLAMRFISVSFRSDVRARDCVMPGRTDARNL